MAADREGQDPWRKFHVTLGILFVPGVILLLIAGGLIWAINDLGLYDRGFEKYNISRHTGITPGGLHEAGADIRGYFNSAAEPLLVTAQVYGEEREIFNHREVEHMRDVKGLVRGVYLAGGGALVYVLGVIVGGFCRFGAAFTRRLAWMLLWGGAATLGTLAVFGVAAAVGFGWLFLIFHQISFSNDLWMLDPRTDYLLIMFPLGFWFDATLRVAATAATGAGLLIVGAAAGLLYLRRKVTGVVPPAA